jgi:hypothetical protein
VNGLSVSLFFHLGPYFPECLKIKDMLFRFEVHMSGAMKITVVWDMMVCHLVAFRSKKTLSGFLLCVFSL